MYASDHYYFSVFQWKYHWRDINPLHSKEQIIRKIL